ncbi:Alpha/Beta hydrolase protein [Armillaria luteobubalina]|uniref:Alpha/Beta hydrolase protein n=1 Tax=Armillaria luteobubalina TaxID=153913 RepID=A0AA39Q8E8_9AGAR|nr:Alpha/Beta hydrolase protein [Armillaria luteobubalina]
MTAPYSTVLLPDGAVLAFEVLGSQHLGHHRPLVLVCGMGSIRTDWERLSTRLAEKRPVLVYDHRGMGDSSYRSGDEITIEILSRDLLFLIESLRWKDVSICGFSMGGVIAQQLLLLPFHPTEPAPIHFRCTHLFLAGTRSVVLRDHGLGLQYSKPPCNMTRTPAEKLEIAKRLIQATLDPVWLQENPSRFAVILKRTLTGGARPPESIAQQGVALKSFDFEHQLVDMPRNTRILVVHGRLDKVIPFSFGQDITNMIPWATMVSVGSKPGQVPSYDFGHYWYEYFDIQVWVDVVEKFLKK